VKKTALLLMSLLASALLSPLVVVAARAADGPSSRVGGLLARSEIWTQYRDRFVKNDGRVVDTANGDASHSESEGYGLLLAVAAGDRATFDSILGWTTEHLIARGDGLVAWKASDANDAADGDILVAWALAEAVDYWRDPKYLAPAKALAGNVAARLVVRDARYGLLLRPGAEGFSGADRPDGAVVNPSYWVFPAFERLKQLAPQTDWDALRNSGVKLIDSARSAPTGLPSDWLSLGADVPAPASGFPRGFGYNAVRLPLYAFWGGVEAPELMRNFTTGWEHGDFASAAPATDRPSFVEPGYAKIIALARCASAGDAYPHDFYNFSARQNYYPASLSALAMIAAATRGGPCLDTAAMAVELGGVSPEPAADISRLELTAVADAIPTVDLLPAGSSLPRPAKATIATTSVRPTLASESLLGTAGTIAVISVLGAIGFAFHRRRERQRKQLLETMFSPGAASEAGTKAVPRTLPVNPYDDATSPETLPRKMENAAEASKEFGRTLGVIYFDLGEPARGKRKRVAPNREHEVEDLLQRLRKELRGTDHATLIDDREIVACVGLLPGMTELKTISERLRKAGLTFESFAYAFESSPGLSIYPLDGYRGEELIHRARSRYASQRAAAASSATKPATPAGTPRGSRKVPAPARH
jgi:endo-1,4-beta-D-glucanase Y